MRRRTLLLWPILAAAALSLAALVARGPLGSLCGPCPLRALTGVPCPTCGGVRAMRLMLDHSVGAALCANPLLASLYLVLAASGLAALLLLPWAPSVPVPSARAQRRAWIVAAALLALNWLFLLVR